MIKILNNHVTECHQSKVLATISGDTIYQNTCARNDSETIQTKLEKTSKYCTWNIVPNILEKISAVCLFAQYTRITGTVLSRNQEPRIKTPQNSREEVDSWFLVSMDVQVYTGRPLSDLFGQCAVFSQGIGIIGFHGFCSLSVFLSFSEFSRSLQYCSSMRCCFVCVCHGFYSFKEVQFSGRGI